MSEHRAIFTDDQKLFRETVRRFFETEVIPHQEAWEEAGMVPREIWNRCGELGFLLPRAPEEYGGLGLTDFRYEAILIEETARANESGLALSLHNSVVGPYILNYGSEEQKKRLVPGLVSGERVLAIAMTEPDAGSDLAGMKATAVEKDDHWVLNGSKTFITNGLHSDTVIVCAKTDPANPRTIGLFLVHRGNPGFERGRHLKKIGLHSQDTAELFFRDVKVPRHDVLGDPSQGFYYLMNKLAVERLVVCVGAVSGAEAALADTVRYVKERQVFGKPLSSFQNTRFRLAELQTKVKIGRTYVDRLIMDEQEDRLDPADCCGAKYWTTELACEVADECLQLYGGYGYMSEYPISRRFVNSRVGKIYAGSNEIMKLVVSRSMGL